MASVPDPNWHDSDEQERMRLAQRVARLWTWDYDVSTDTVVWTIPRETGDGIVKSSFKSVLERVRPERGKPMSQDCY